MMEASIKNKLPQEGTTKSGESLPESNSGCPTYSGGGKNLHKFTDTEEVGSQASSVAKTGLTTGKRITDVDKLSETERGVEARTQTGRVETRRRKTGTSGLSTATSVDSLMTVQSYEEDRLWAKRKRSSGASCSGSSTEEGRTRQAKKASKRGKGRGAAAAGFCVGTASARKTLADMTAARKALSRVRRESELEASEETQVSRASRAGTSRAGESVDGRVVDDSTAALQRRIEESLDAIEQVRAKSSNLRVAFKRSLKDASDTIQEAVVLLAQRTVSEETRQLQAANSQLQAEVAGLRKEMGEMRAIIEAAQPKQTRVDSDLTAEILRQVGGMVDARLEALDLPPKRRVRPPLAGDGRVEGMAVGQAPTEDFPPLPSPKPPNRAPAKGAAPAKARKPEQPAAQPAKPGPAAKAKGKGKEKAARQPDKTKPADKAVPTTSSAPQLQQRLEQEWTVVGKKGKAKKKKRPVRERTRAQRLRNPSSSAVVIALQPGAEERGVTYASIMAGSRQKIDLAEIGVGSLRFKRAATGARILEIPGAASSKEADALAAKLREIWDEGTVKVSRPVKCAEVHIIGLDDSAAVEDVVAAISRAGECPTEHVKCSGLRVGSRGSTSAWVSCPIAAAKKVAQVGRVQVGWISASVTLGRVKPQRCFRCLEVGHVRVACNSPVDRSNVCFRCGETGHKAGECSASAARCVLCSEAKLPAGHRLGGPACKAPKRKRGNQGRDGPGTAPCPCPAPAEANVTVSEMET
ncbi:uncharacterized protein LOC123699033 [Colias croceus]|uniref:uncharacterized protein LOC123699033 n=1 Tax=Colias crocea TaxID=72248 RepID=UPI001E28177E|nr:uncharacterized protein LOC123699033 [Colias croceus]